MRIPLSRAAIVALCVCTGTIVLLHCTPSPVYRHYYQSSRGRSAGAARKAEGRPQAAAAEKVQQSGSIQSDSPQTDARQTNARDTDTWNLDKDQSAGHARAQRAPSYPANAWYSDGPDFHAPSACVRVMLRQNASDVRVASSGPMTVRGAAINSVPLQGLRCVAAHIERASAPGRVRCDIDGGDAAEIVLPCTLFSKSEFNIVKIEEASHPVGYAEASYRGSVIIAADGPAFSVLNYVAVDDYLRGVVPLEVGKGSDEVIEAVKAQAVAARTYTYRKMQENSGNLFDLSATVSDQVYGGVAAESEVCNRAIHSTQGEVIVFHDSLIYAYYHSTCGGRTANIEDVWNKSGMPYLRSVEDGDGPFCSQSASFTWEEQWPVPQFSFIVNKYSREAFPQNPCRGEMRDISIRSKFQCGRTRELCITTSEGLFVYGGDKLRFALRRNTSGFPILKSSLLTDAKVSGGTVVIRGRGYGHGVGMCQTGALGRARRGQGYKDIVKAYYAGIEIKKISLSK